MMRVPRPTVKRGRPYDSSNRRLAAQERREQVLQAASARFAADGYAATSVAAVAADAGVSPEMVYKAFGAKPGLVRALMLQALAGEGPVPAEERSDALTDAPFDPRDVIAGWARLTVEVSPRAAPVALLVREAAASDAAAARLRAELDQRRLERMRHNADAIRAHLRPGLGVEAAGDVLFAFSAPELYELLVMQRGWALPAYAEFVRRGLVAQLLAD
jgi:AcrR family transcriptional regulator